MLLANANIRILTVQSFNRRPNLLKQTDKQTKKSHSVLLWRCQVRIWKKSLQGPSGCKSTKNSVLQTNWHLYFSYFIQCSREVSWAPIQSELPREEMHCVSQLPVLKLNTVLCSLGPCSLLTLPLTNCKATPSPHYPATLLPSVFLHYVAKEGPNQRFHQFSSSLLCTCFILNG